MELQHAETQAAAESSLRLPIRHLHFGTGQSATVELQPSVQLLQPGQENPFTNYIGKLAFRFMH
jgi:hypothetical protein